MGCSDDKSIQVHNNEETNQNQDEEENLLIEKDFPDFEEYNSKYKYKIIIILLYFNKKRWKKNW